MTPKLSLIIPAYNEETRLDRSLLKATEFLAGNGLSYEIILIDDGSSDNTEYIAKDWLPKIRFISFSQNKGKGAAIRQGMLEAEGEIRIFTDADLSTPIYEIKKIISEIESGNCDVFAGSRALDPSMIKEHQPIYREMMGKTFNKIVQFAVMRGIKDTQCGFKGFTGKAAADIFSRAKINGFGFDVEILYLARKLGYKIKEIPVEWYNDNRSTVNPFKDSIKMLLDILKVRNLHKDL